MLPNAETYTFTTIVRRPMAGKSWFTIPKDAYEALGGLWLGDEVVLNITGMKGTKEVQHA